MKLSFQILNLKQNDQTLYYVFIKEDNIYMLKENNSLQLNNIKKTDYDSNFLRQSFRSQQNFHQQTFHREQNFEQADHVQINIILIPFSSSFAGITSACNIPFLLLQLRSCQILLSSVCSSSLRHNTQQL